VNREIDDVDPGLIEFAENTTQGDDVAVGGDLQARRVVVGDRHCQRVAGHELRLGVGELDIDAATGNLLLELLRAALGDQASAVEDRHPVGELVGLVEVLRGQEHSCAVVDQAPRSPTTCDGCADQGRWSARRGRSPAARRSRPSPGRDGDASHPSRSWRFGQRHRPARAARAAGSRALARWLRDPKLRRATHPRHAGRHDAPPTPLAALGCSRPGTLRTPSARAAPPGVLPAHRSAPRGPPGPDHRRI